MRELKGDASSFGVWRQREEHIWIFYELIKKKNPVWFPSRKDLVDKQYTALFTSDAFGDDFEIQLKHSSMTGNKI